MKHSKLTFSKILRIAGVACGIMSVGQIAEAACTTATTVTSISQNNGQCNGYLGFSTTTSGGNLICTSSAEQARMASSAYLYGHTVRYQLGGGDSDCNPNGSEDEAKALVWLQSM